MWPGRSIWKPPGDYRDRSTRNVEVRETLDGCTDAIEAPVDCLFCRVNDSSVNTIFLESSKFYVRLDNFPATKGHVEIVPKEHVVSLFDLSATDIAEAYDLMRAAQEKLKQEYNPDGFTIGINDGHAAGRTIDHLHIHLIPRYYGDVADPRGGIRQIVPNFNPSLWSPVK